MNVFELSAVATPAAGAIAGGMSVTSAGAASMVLGIGIGVAIGLAIYFSAIGLSGLLKRVPGVVASERLNPLQWLASIAAVLLPAASPLAAYAVSVFVIVSCYIYDALVVMRRGYNARYGIHENEAQVIHV